MRTPREKCLPDTLGNLLGFGSGRRDASLGRVHLAEPTSAPNIASVFAQFVGEKERESPTGPHQTEAKSSAMDTLREEEGRGTGRKEAGETRGRKEEGTHSVLGHDHGGLVLVQVEVALRHLEQHEPLRVSCTLSLSFSPTFRPKRRNPAPPHFRRKNLQRLANAAFNRLHAYSINSRAERGEMETGARRGREMVKRAATVASARRDAATRAKDVDGLASMVSPGLNTRDVSTFRACNVLCSSLSSHAPQKYGRNTGCGTEPCGATPSNENDAH